MLRWVTKLYGGVGVLWQFINMNLGFGRPPVCAGEHTLLLRLRADYRKNKLLIIKIVEKIVLCIYTKRDINLFSQEKKYFEKDNNRFR